MKKKLLLTTFALTVLAQLWIPALLIVNSEEAFFKGREYKFRTAPVDPYDAFRGKYVSLYFRDNQVITDRDYNKRETKHYAGSPKVYVLLKDSCGYAKPSSLSITRPEDDCFVKAHVSSYFSRGGTTRIYYPFDKFFLPENKAQKAEVLYRRHQRDGAVDCYAIVKINKRGDAVIKDLVLGGVGVLEAVEQR